MNEQIKQLGEIPAFPAEVGYDNGKLSDSIQTGNYSAMFSGISKRFYAACAALPGILSNPNVNNHTLEWHVEKAYECADQLLKQENNEKI